MKALKRKGLGAAGLALTTFFMVNLLVMVQTVQAAGETKEYVQL
jgi:hypothetical protein